MQQQIKHWLKFDRTYNAAVILYQTFGNSLSFKAILNRQGETPYNKGLLIEELRKLAGIDPDELKHILSLPVEKKIVKAVIVIDTPGLEEETHQEDEIQEEQIQVPEDNGKKKASRSASEKESGSGKNSHS